MMLATVSLLLAAVPDTRSCDSISPRAYATPCRSPSSRSAARQRAGVRRRGGRRQRPAHERPVRTAGAPRHGRPATSGAEIRYEDWRLLKSDFIVVGRVEPDAVSLRTAQRTDRCLAADAAPAVQREGAQGRGASHRRPGVRGASRESQARSPRASPTSRWMASRRRNATVCSLRTRTVSAAHGSGIARADHVARLVAGWSEPCVRVLRGQGLRRSMCRRWPRVNADGCRQGPASTARPPGRRTAAGSRLRFPAMATSTSTRSNSPLRSSRASPPTTRSIPEAECRRRPEPVLQSIRPGW